MRISYDEENHTLIIKDRLKTHLMLINLIMIVNVVNAVLTYYNNQLAGIKTGWLIIALGVVSLIVLMFTLTRSTIDQVSLNEIVLLKEKSVMGKRRFSLKLKNGKTRNLYIKDDEISAFEKLTDRLQIKKSTKIT